MRIAGVNAAGYLDWGSHWLARLEYKNNGKDRHNIKRFGSRVGAANA